MIFTNSQKNPKTPKPWGVCKCGEEDGGEAEPVGPAAAGIPPLGTSLAALHPMASPALEKRPVPVVRKVMACLSRSQEINESHYKGV